MAIFGASPILQEVSANFAASTTGTTLTPVDDTIPQITEGDEYMTLAIVPKSSTSTLEIEGFWFGTALSVDFITVSLFQDSTANAIFADNAFNAVANGGVTIPFAVSITSGTTSSTTIRVRAGLNGIGTITFNGRVAARLYGAIPKSHMTITERL